MDTFPVNTPENLLRAGADTDDTLELEVWATEQWGECEVGLTLRLSECGDNIQVHFEPKVFKDFMKTLNWLVSSQNLVRGVR